MTADRWTCRYCGRAFVVASLTREHETTEHAGNQ